MLQIFVIATCVMLTTHYSNALMSTTVISEQSTLTSSVKYQNNGDAKVTETNRERVAICYAGNLRTFHHEFVHQVLLDRTIAPLKAHYDTDVFFYVRLDDAPQIHAPARAPGPLSLKAALKFEPVDFTLVSNGTVDEATREFMASREWKEGPFRHEVIADELGSVCDRWEVDAQTNMDVLRAPDHCDTTTRIRFPHTLMRSKQCLHKILERERSLGFKYDWVYRLRPDTVLLDEIPLPRELNRSIAYTNQANPGASKHAAILWRRTRNVTRAGGGPINDQVMFSSRLVAAEFMSALSGINDCESYDSQLGMRPPENTLRLWMMKNKIEYRAIPFAWATILEHGGPTCDKLLYQNVPDHEDWKYALRLCLSFGEQVQPFFSDAPNFTQALLDLPALNRSSKQMYAYTL